MIKGDSTYKTILNIIPEQLRARKILCRELISRITQACFSMMRYTWRIRLVGNQAKPIRRASPFTFVACIIIKLKVKNRPNIRPSGDPCIGNILPNVGRLLFWRGAMVCDITTWPRKRVTDGHTTLSDPNRLVFPACFCQGLLNTTRIIIAVHHIRILMNCRGIKKAIMRSRQRVIFKGGDKFVQEIGAPLILRTIKG